MLMLGGAHLQAMSVYSKMARVQLHKEMGCAIVMLNSVSVMGLALDCAMTRELPLIHLAGKWCSLALAAGIANCSALIVLCCSTRAQPETGVGKRPALTAHLEHL